MVVALAGCQSTPDKPSGSVLPPASSGSTTTNAPKCNTGGPVLTSPGVTFSPNKDRATLTGSVYCLDDVEFLYLATYNPASGKYEYYDFNPASHLHNHNWSMTVPWFPNAQVTYFTGTGKACGAAFRRHSGQHGQPAQTSDMGDCRREGVIPLIG